MFQPNFTADDIIASNFIHLICYRKLKVPYLIDREMFARAWKELKQSKYKEISPEVEEWFDLNENVRYCLKAHLKRHPYLYEGHPKIQEFIDMRDALIQLDLDALDYLEARRRTDINLVEQQELRDLVNSVYVLRTAREDFLKLLVTVINKKRIYRELALKVADKLLIERSVVVQE